MVIPHPLEIRKRMQAVSTGSLTTLDEIRQSLAQEHLVDIACPMTTGLFVRLVAESSREEELETRICPIAYWRTLKPKGDLNPNFPG